MEGREAPYILTFCEEILRIMQSSRRSESDWQGLVSEVRPPTACCGGGLIRADAPLSIWKQLQCLHIQSCSHVKLRFLVLS